MGKDFPPELLLDLARAVVVQAVKDARRGNEEAREWLKSPDAELYLCALGYEPEAVARGLNALEYRKQPVGCP